MKLGTCISCRHYLGNSEEAVMCKLYPDMIMERILVLYELPEESWVFDSPRMPVLITPRGSN